MPTYNPSSSSLTVSVALLVLPTTITVSANLTTIPEEAMQFYNVTLKTLEGVAVVGRTVTLRVTAGGVTTTLTGLTSSIGVAPFQVTIPNAGIASFVATFLGDTSYSGSTSPIFAVTVSEIKIDTLISPSVPSNILEDTDITISATLKYWNTLTSTMVVIAGAPLTLTINTVSMGTVTTNASGVATWTVKFSDPGTYGMVVSFAGLTTTT
jgi:hypothetical protein